MFHGYMALAGEEIANSARTRAYVQNNMPTFPLTSIENLGELAAVLGDVCEFAYTSPQADPAPWYEPRRPETAMFYGFYALSIEGADGSTRYATVLEGILDGGAIGRPRNATRQIRVRGVLVAGNKLALDAGAVWLRGALESATAARVGYCSGAHLELYAAPPAVGVWPTQTNARPGGAYERNFVEVVCVEGPKTVSEYQLNGRDGECSGAMRQVDFLLVAGAPFCYGPTSVLDAISGAGATSWDDAANPCPAPAATVIVDPACPVIPPPPRPPVVPDSCATNPTVWWRVATMIDESYVAQWNPTVASINIENDGSAIGQMRVRFYPNPLNLTAGAIDPCSWSSEFILGYLPAGMALTMDGVTRQAWFSTPGDPAQISASNLLFGTGGIPITWPVLTDGVSYLMTVDMVDTSGAPGTAPTVQIVVSLTDRM